MFPTRCLIALCLLFSTGWLPAAPAEPKVRVLFADEDTPRDAILRQINLTKTSIHLMMYSFTDGTISGQLAAAHKRGVKVVVVLDDTQNKGKNSEGPFLVSQGIPVHISRGQDRGGVMHNKLAIFDGKTLITGSYNWTNNAHEHNHENLVIIEDAKAAQDAEKEFQRVLAKAVPLAPN